MKFFGDNARAWTYTFVVFGALEIITFMITFLFTRERVNTSEDRMSVPISLGFKALVKNKYWFMATLNLVLIFIAQGVNGSSEVYYAKCLETEIWLEHFPWHFRLRRSSACSLLQVL